MRLQGLSLTAHMDGAPGRAPVARLALIGLLLLALAARAQATTFVVADDADMLDAADVVVVGKVASTRVLEDDGRVDTLAEVEVSEWVEGSSPETVSVRLPGGEGRRLQKVVYGQPELAAGERVLLFLRDGGDGTYRVAHMAMGKYRVVGSGREALAVRDLQGAVVLRARRNRLIHRSPQEVRRLADLKRSLRAGGESYSEVMPVPPPSVTQSFRGAFSMLGSTPARWNEADEGRPLVYMVEPTSASATGLDAFWAVAQATGAWTNVDCARVTLAATAGGEKRPFDSCDGKNQILFGDPFNEIDPPSNCKGVLGVGGFCSSSGGRSVGGVNYNRITEGDVVINRGFESCSFWNEMNLAEMLAHELGHTLGLGHSSESRSESDPVLRDALMYYRSHFDGRGATVMEDDERGICSIYPDPAVADDDGDGVANAGDNCPATANPAQEDADGDAVGDACDPLVLDRAMLCYDEGSGALDSRVKISGILRPGKALDPAHETLVIHLRNGTETTYRTTVLPGSWRVEDDGRDMSVRLRSEEAIETIAMFRQADGSYRFRMRGRGLFMFGSRDGSLTLDVGMGNFAASSPMPLRPRRPGKLVFP